MCWIPWKWNNPWSHYSTSTAWLITTSYELKFHIGGVRNKEIFKYLWLLQDEGHLLFTSWQNAISNLSYIENHVVEWTEFHILVPVMFYLVSHILEMVYVMLTLIKIHSNCINATNKFSSVLSVVTISQWFPYICIVTTNYHYQY